MIRPRNKKGPPGIGSHRFYATWAGMLSRCKNKNHEAYPRYGGRGITVCDDWLDSSVFVAWLEANGYEKGLDIDRMDNDKGYFPENCRVVTRQVNCRNRGNNKRYMIHGEYLMAHEVEEKYGVKQKTFRGRVNRDGRTPEDALINKYELRRYRHEVNGVLMSAKEISQKFGISIKTFGNRVDRGWDAERAALTPVRG